VRIEHGGKQFQASAGIECGGAEGGGAAACVVDGVVKLWLAAEEDSRHVSPTLGCPSYSCARVKSDR
jgi:hypothetical protein